MDFTTNDDCGLLIEGHEHPPIVLSPWQHPYYKLEQRYFTEGLKALRHTVKPPIEPVWLPQASPPPAQQCPA